MRLTQSLEAARLTRVVALFIASSASTVHAQAVDLVTTPPVGTPEPSFEGTVDVDEPEPLAPKADEARLGDWLEYLAKSGRKNRLMTGSSMLLSGAVMMGFGIWAFVRTPSNNELDKGIGLLSIAGAGVFMPFGIVRLATKSSSEELFERWGDATRSGLTLRELGRFEGQFRGHAEAVQREILAGRWANFGLALTGGLILGLTPAASLSPNAATVGYVTGGVAVGLGLMSFGLSFRAMQEADDWKHYEEGLGPPRWVRWSASPDFGRQFVGARVAGRF
jgi:hypothetical protein